MLLANPFTGMVINTRGCNQYTGRNCSGVKVPRRQLKLQARKSSLDAFTGTIDQLDPNEYGLLASDSEGLHGLERKVHGLGLKKPVYSSAELSRLHETAAFDLRDYANRFKADGGERRMKMYDKLSKIAQLHEIASKSNREMLR